LKSKLRQQQDNNKKKGKVIKELKMRIKHPKMKAHFTRTNPHLINSLKAKKLETKSEKQQLLRQIKKLKKNSKYTYIRELKAEQKVYDYEVQRLENLLASTENINEQVPVEDIETIKIRIREQNEILHKLKEEQKVLLDELKKKEKEIEKYKKIADEPEDEDKIKEIQELKAQVNTMKNIQGVSEEELEELQRINKITELNIEQQKERIKELQDALKEVEAMKETVFREKTSSEDKREATAIAEMLQDNLKTKGIEVKDIKKEVFERLDNNEKISVHELAKTFSRQPCKLPFDKALILSEWLIDTKHPTYTMQYTEERVLSKVLKRLASLLNVEINKDLPELEHMTEDDVMLVLQKLFARINDRIITSSKSIREVFSRIIYTTIMDKEEIEIVNTEAFLELCEDELDVKIEPIERLCFTDMISIGETEKVVKLKDIEYIMRGFELEDEEYKLDFDELDNISMVLMFTLAEYIVSAKIVFYKLFADCIYQQDVEIDGHDIKIDLINSRDFFNILNKIGITIQDGEHKNLKEFLCIDPEYPGKLVVKKLKKAIEEFATNEELRNKAYKHYKELDNEDSGEDIPHKHGKRTA